MGRWPVVGVKWYLFVVRKRRFSFLAPPQPEYAQISHFLPLNRTLHIYEHIWLAWNTNSCQFFRFPPVKSVLSLYFNPNSHFFQPKIPYLCCNFVHFVRLSLVLSGIVYFSLTAQFCLILSNLVNFCLTLSDCLVLSSIILVCNFLIGSGFWHFWTCWALLWGLSRKEAYVLVLFH